MKTEQIETKRDQNYPQKSPQDKDRYKIGGYRMQPPPSQWDMRVYFIKAQTVAGDLVKIGIAVEPSVRLKQLSTLSPVPLEIIGECQGGRKLERALHAEFDVLRSHGEWFRLVPKLEERISALCAPLYGGVGE